PLRLLCREALFLQLQDQSLGPPGSRILLSPFLTLIWSSRLIWNGMLRTDTARCRPRLRSAPSPTSPRLLSLALEVLPTRDRVSAAIAKWITASGRAQQLARAFALRPNF